MRGGYRSVHLEAGRQSANAAAAFLGIRHRLRRLRRRGVAGPLLVRPDGAPRAPVAGRRRARRRPDRPAAGAAPGLAGPGFHLDGPGRCRPGAVADPRGAVPGRAGDQPVHGRHHDEAGGGARRGGAGGRCRDPRGRPGWHPSLGPRDLGRRRVRGHCPGRWPVREHSPGLPRRAARPGSAARARTRPEQRTGRGAGAGAYRPGDARQRGPPPHGDRGAFRRRPPCRHPRARRGGRCDPGRVGHCPAGAGRDPPPARRAAGRLRAGSPAAAARPGGPGRPARPGPGRRPARAIRTQRRRRGPGARYPACRLPARPGGPDEHDEARRRGRERGRPAAAHTRRGARGSRRRRHRQHRRTPRSWRRPDRDARAHQRVRRRAGLRPAPAARRRVTARLRTDTAAA